MIIQPEIWRRLEIKILDRRALDAEKIVAGSCKTMEAYAEHVGYVRALDWVLALAHEINEPKKEDEIEELTD